MSGAPSIHALRPEDADEVAALIAKSFEADPSFRWFFPEGEERGRKVSAFCSFMIERTLRAGDFALGARDADAKLVAFALAENRRGALRGELRRGLADLSLYWARLKPLGADTLRRMAAYHAASRKKLGVQPSAYLVMIGVTPEARGRGLARALIERVKNLDQSLPGASGLSLDTENPQNVDIYRRLGFTLRDELSLDGLSVYLFQGIGNSNAHADGSRP